MPKHTNGVEQATQDQNHVDANASLPTSDDPASKSLTDSVGAKTETTHNEVNDNNQDVLPPGSKSDSFDTRNKQFLKTLARQNKKQREEDIIEQQRLIEYKEKLENQVRKRLGGNLVVGTDKRDKLEKSEEDSN